MTIKDGMGSYLTVTRCGSKVHIDCTVGLWPLLIQYVLVVVIAVAWRLYK